MRLEAAREPPTRLDEPEDPAMPLLPLFYLQHRADGTAVLVCRGQVPDAGRDTAARRTERAAAAGSLAVQA